MEDGPDDEPDGRVDPQQPRAYHVGRPVPHGHAASKKQEQDPLPDALFYGIFWPAMIIAIPGQFLGRQLAAHLARVVEKSRPK